MRHGGSERGEINVYVDTSKYFEILKKVLADYPQSNFAPAWQLAIASDTNKLGDFQKVTQEYQSNDFICAIAYTKMGEIYRSEGKNEKAKESFQKALSLIDECIKNKPKNAAYNYYKAIIKIKETGETFDWLELEKGYPPEGRVMRSDIFSELRKGNNKGYYSTPYLDLHSIIDLYNPIGEIKMRLKAQADYYENQGDTDKVIESYQTMLKIGKHIEEENQTLVTEVLGRTAEFLAHSYLREVFEKYDMNERMEELEKTNKVIEERNDKTGLIAGLVRGWFKVILNKDLSDLPPEDQADPEKAVKEAVEEALDIVENNNLIKDKNLEARILICYLLSRLGGERATAILKEGLSDKDPYVRFFVEKIFEEH